MDASEASKHPDRHDYYFGHLDAARVAFTMGRDLVLKPRQNGEPLNYLIRILMPSSTELAVPQKENQDEVLLRRRGQVTPLHMLFRTSRTARSC